MPKSKTPATAPPEPTPSLREVMDVVRRFALGHYPRAKHATVLITIADDLPKVIVPVIVGEVFGPE